MHLPARGTYIYVRATPANVRGLKVGGWGTAWWRADKRCRTGGGDRLCGDARGCGDGLGTVARGGRDEDGEVARGGGDGLGEDMSIGGDWAGGGVVPMHSGVVPQKTPGWPGQ
eukprot:scaffold3635_cov31-Tisochrysis_lutea.AAC.3